jgi:hypothetical protein
LKGRSLLHYHYTESGLDNVFLRSGFALENDAHYGELVSFTGVFGLHDRLDRILVSQAPYLTGAAMRILRTDVFEQSHEDFAMAMGMREADVRYLENNRDGFVGADADLALRSYVCEHKQMTEDQSLFAYEPDADRPFFIIMALENGVWTGGISYAPPTQLTV